MAGSGGAWRYLIRSESRQASPTPSPICMISSSPVYGQARDAFGTRRFRTSKCAHWRQVGTRSSYIALTSLPPLRSGLTVPYIAPSLGAHVSMLQIVFAYERW